jgi:hypothetical protein
MSNLPAHVLTERRALINAANAASAALHTASKAVAGDMGLVNDRDAIASERAAWLAAERDLAAFYVRYPMRTYKREFAAESKAHRGR